MNRKNRAFKHRQLLKKQKVSREEKRLEQIRCNPKPEKKERNYPKKRLDGEVDQRRM